MWTEQQKRRQNPQPPRRARLSAAENIRSAKKECVGTLRTRAGELQCKMLWRLVFILCLRFCLCFNLSHFPSMNSNFVCRRRSSIMRRDTQKPKHPGRGVSWTPKLARRGVFQFVFFPCWFTRFFFFCGLIYFIHVLTACRLAEVVKRVADVKEDPILGKAFVLKPVVNWF